jgi:anti-sigma factor RsiW
MMGHVSTRRMHEILDGELATAELDRIEGHLASCAACREQFAALADAHRDLGSLPRLAAPPEGAWTRIAERIALSEPQPAEEVAVLPLPVDRLGRRRFSLSTAQLAAVAAAVVTLWAGSLWLVLRTPGGGAAGSPAGPAASDAGPAARAVAATGDEYDRVVSDLEQILAEGRGVLAPTTILSIEESLLTLDEAIADVRAALASDPGSEMLVRLLANHQRTKLGVLERAARAVRTQT